MSNNSVTLHRVIKTTPEKLYRAFTDANVLAAWLPPYGYVGVPDQLDLKVGGKYRMSFINFTTGNQQFFGGTYLELEPNKFLKYKDKIDDPAFPEEMTTSVWITKNIAGTDLKIIQENIPAAIPAEMCYLGWQDSLDKLTRLVEPEITEG